jgi:hypothetical protein
VAPARLADLAAGLRDAEQARDGRRLRELSERRRRLLDDLASQAFAAAGLPDPPSALRDEVTGTLAAALADPEVAADVESGTLTRPATWSGFGLASGPGLASGLGEESPDDAGAQGDVPAAQDAAGERIAPVPLPPQAPRALPPQRSRGGAQPPSAGQPSALAPPASQAPAGASPAAQPAGASPAPVSRLAPRRSPSLQAEASRRSPAEDAERAVSTAAEIATAASAAEELLEDHVRDLEQQLTKARAELADARRKARHAESAERKARQARDRLQGPH